MGVGMGERERKGFTFYVGEVVRQHDGGRVSNPSNGRDELRWMDGSVDRCEWVGGLVGG